MLLMVMYLIEGGVPAAAIGEVIGPRFRSIEGEHGKDPVPAFLTAYRALYGKEFAPWWWYTDYPFCQDGRTWLLDKGWRRDDTEPTLSALCERFPQACVSFRRADA